MDKQEYINSLVSQGLSDEEILNKVNEKFKTSSPDFQTPIAPGAVVEETAAPYMDSSLDPGSGDLQKNESPKKDFDAGEELSTADDLFKANFKRAKANIAEVPAFLNRWKMSLVKKFAFSDEQKENFEKLSAE